MAQSLSSATASKKRPEYTMGHQTPKRSPYHSPNLYSGHTWSGLRVGILGGSFNPPHQGHIHISMEARKRLNLDCVLWLVTPGNPLKTGTNPSFRHRLEAAQTLTQNIPHIVVSELEQEINSRYTAHSVNILRKRFPKTHFIWLAGSDIITEFHKWDRWTSLLRQIPFAFFSRPPHGLEVRHSRLSLFLDKKLRTPANTMKFNYKKQQHFRYHISMNRESSTKIRSDAT